jgi:hypothetical protein
MADPIKSGLEGALDQFEASRRRAAEFRKGEQGARALFADVFAKLTDDVIAPAINDVVKKLQARRFTAALQIKGPGSPDVKLEFQDEERLITIERGSTPPAEIVFRADAGKRLVRIEGRSSAGGKNPEERTAESLTRSEVSKIIEDFVEAAIKAATR